jgi:peroxiredoxin Q/BCP
MDTAAACRTYNILAGEGRNVWWRLLLEQRRSWTEPAELGSRFRVKSGLRSGASTQSITDHEFPRPINDYILSHEIEVDMAIVVNKPLPEFEANATGGVKVSNTSHLGHCGPVLLSQGQHPGCTTEAMQFRDKYKDFVKAGAVVFGVSRDNMKSHDEFKAKLELPFELIADTEEKMCHMFGVVKNKIMYGKKVKGIERSTFLIGADGICWCRNGAASRCPATWTKCSRPSRP